MSTTDNHEQRSARILTVDDDPTFRQIVLALLRSEGYTVREASDGLTAIKLLQQESFDLVLLDLGLPGAGGLEVLAGAASWKSQPKVIVVSGDTTGPAILGSVRGQAYHYLAKPVNTVTLANVIQDALAAPAAMPLEVLSAREDWVELLVPCEASAPERVQSFLRYLEGDLPKATRESVGRAFCELLMNAIEWGGELDPRRRVRISFLKTVRFLMYRISDPGAGFQPEQLHHAAVTNESDEPFGHMSEREAQGLRPGGFGLLMAGQLVDELVFNEAHNEVVLIKYLN